MSLPQPEQVLYNFCYLYLIYIFLIQITCKTAMSHFLNSLIPPGRVLHTCVNKLNQIWLHNNLLPLWYQASILMGANWNQYKDGILHTRKCIWKCLIFCRCLNMCRPMTYSGVWRRKYKIPMIIVVNFLSSNLPNVLFHSKYIVVLNVLGMLVDTSGTLSSLCRVEDHSA